MDATLADDSRQLENLRSFRRDLAERDFAADESGLVTALVSPQAGGYRVAGSEACRECHPRDFDIWHASSHATAWRTLRTEGAQVDPFCQQCHTTAYGLPGGFASVARSPERVDVGCESCHGPAHAHAADPRTKTSFAARDQCQRCHDRENSPQFAFEAYWERIQHPRADEQSDPAISAIGGENSP